jgi:hypothetical protein
MSTYSTLAGAIWRPVALLAITVSAASASTQRPKTLDSLLVEAELIFSGTVLAIDHRESSIGAAEHVALPHTFVSYRVDHVLRGAATVGSSITLRYLGGPASSDRILKVSGVPEFEVGDQDLLFVRRNGISPCPLVGWEQGRFRIVRGGVFDEFGREIWLTPNAQLVRGEVAIDVHAPFYPAVQLGAGAQDDAGADRSDGWIPPPGSARPDADSFREVVRLMAVAVEQAGRLKSKTPFRSASIGELFFVREPRAVAPPKPATKSAAAETGDSTVPSEPASDEPKSSTDRDGE